jgi:hypothetical protein
MHPRRHCCRVSGSRARWRTRWSSTAALRARTPSRSSRTRGHSSRSSWTTKCCWLRATRRAGASSRGSHRGRGWMAGRSSAPCTRSKTLRCIKSLTMPGAGMRSRRRVVRRSRTSRGGSSTRRRCWRGSMAPSGRAYGRGGRSASRRISSSTGARARRLTSRRRSIVPSRPTNGGRRCSASRPPSLTCMPGCMRAASCTATSIRGTSSPIATAVSRYSISRSRDGPAQTTRVCPGRGCPSTMSRSWRGRCLAASRRRRRRRRANSSRSPRSSTCCSRASTIRTSSSSSGRSYRRSAMGPCCHSLRAAPRRGRRPRRCWGGR